MVETALVEKTLVEKGPKNVVVLKKVRPEACHGCNAKILCGAKTEFRFKALNKADIKLQIGDMVEYTLPEVSAAKLSFFVYIVPLLVFFATLSLILWISPGAEYLSVIVGLLLMFLTFLVIGFYDKNKLSKTMLLLPTINKKIENND